uniref:Putative secreted protein n=1 Tax=Anopheles darlingi TaxID=43151 RepID=A0A2M4DN83_ANODA
MLGWMPTFIILLLPLPGVSTLPKLPFVFCPLLSSRMPRSSFPSSSVPASWSSPLSQASASLPLPVAQPSPPCRCL